MRTVPAPVSIAELRARQVCTSARDASSVIHTLPPVADPVRPSKLMAIFSRTKGRPRSNRGKEPGIERARLGAEHPDRHGNARRTQSPDSLARNPRIRIFGRAHHAADSSRYQRIGARRRAARVAAGFQRDIRGRLARLAARGPQREHLGVRFAGAHMPAFAN